MYLNYSLTYNKVVIFSLKNNIYLKDTLKKEQCFIEKIK